MPDYEKVPSDEEDGDDRIPAQFVPDDGIPSEVKEFVQRILQNGKIPYSEMFLFEEAGGLLLFNEKYYKVQISIGLMVNKMHHVNSVFIEGAGPNIIRENFSEA